jgi:hypothetical protein
MQVRRRTEQGPRSVQEKAKGSGASTPDRGSAAGRGMYLPKYSTQLSLVAIVGTATLACGLPARSAMMI